MDMLHNASSSNGGAMKDVSLRKNAYSADMERKVASSMEGTLKVENSVQLNEINRHQPCIQFRS